MGFTVVSQRAFLLKNKQKNWKKNSSNFMLFNIAKIVLSGQ